MEPEGRRTRSCSLLTSIENVDFKRMSTKVDKERVLESYGWHRPERPIVERKRQTDSRREELLNLLYQDTITTSQAEEMMKEWISLVVERDRLLREQLDKENQEEKVEYLRQLKGFLREQPALGDGSEEMSIREALLSLEKHVTHYCRKHQIKSPPPDSKVQSQPVRQGRVEDHHHEQRPLHKALHQPNILDHETGQTGIPIVGDSSHSSVHQFRRISPAVEDCDGSQQHTMKPKSVVRSGGGQETKLCYAQTAPPASMVRRPPDQIPTPHSFGGLVQIPPVAPPPPSVSPSSSLPPTVTSTHPRASTHTGNTVAGTMQFAISNSNTISDNPPQVSRVKFNTAGPSPTDISTTTTDRSSVAATSMVHPDPPMECPSSEERQQLMDEIATVGQSALRRTGRPKSPGGTPIKHSRNRLTLTGNTDMLQRALISKFRSLHSTPIGHRSPAGVDKSGSLDLSSAWSDINGSSTAYEDPDLSSTPPSALLPPNSSSSTHNRLDVAEPNSSTAV